MGIFNRPKKGGFADVIRCDESEYLVWKWHPNKYDEGDLKRETAIRTNSILRVKNGEVAVFFYKQGDGHFQDFIEGPFEETIKTKNFPVLSSIIGLWYEGDTPFQAEVFFINVAKAVQIKFGIPYFNVTDPRYPDFEVPVAVRGTITFGIEDYKDFVAHQQLVTFSVDDLKKKVIDTVTRYVKDAVISAPSENGITVINIESKIDAISEKCEQKIKDKVAELYGVQAHGVDISAIEVDKESESYQELKSITKDLIKRQAEANTLNYEEQLRIQREEGQYAQHMQTRQANLGAYQTEVSGQVGVAGAQALGKMGENGAGNVNLGGAGFNPVTMMAGMAVGSAVGQNISGTLNKSMNQNQITQTPPPVTQTPPPVPTVKYYLAVDGKPTGPYDVNTLKSMISAGSFTANSLVWKEGMSEWQPAKDQTEFKGAFPPQL